MAVLPLETEEILPAKSPPELGVHCNVRIVFVKFFKALNNNVFFY
jgi:hypothetical protein